MNKSSKCVKSYGVSFALKILTSFSKSEVLFQSKLYLITNGSPYTLCLTVWFGPWLGRGEYFLGLSDVVVSSVRRKRILKCLVLSHKINQFVYSLSCWTRKNIFWSTFGIYSLPVFINNHQHSCPRGHSFVHVFTEAGFFWKTGKFWYGFTPYT